LARSLIATADGQRTLLEAIHHHQPQMIDYGSAAVRPSVHTAEQTISTKWLGRSMFRSALRLFAADPSLNRKAFADPTTTESRRPGQSHNKTGPDTATSTAPQVAGPAVAHARPPKPDGHEHLCLNQPCRAPLLTRFLSAVHRAPPEHASTPDRAHASTPHRAPASTPDKARTIRPTDGSTRIAIWRRSVMVSFLLGPRPRSRWSGRDGQCERQDRGHSRVTQELGRHGHRPAGVDPVIDKQDGAVHRIETFGEWSVDGQLLPHLRQT
jgi:hypothetical protein